jgi:hypothetical protein
VLPELRESLHLKLALQTLSTLHSTDWIFLEYLTYLTSNHLIRDCNFLSASLIEKCLHRKRLNADGTGKSMVSHLPSTTDAAAFTENFWHGYLSYEGPITNRYDRVFSGHSETNLLVHDQWQPHSAHAGMPRDKIDLPTKPARHYQTPWPWRAITSEQVAPGPTSVLEDSADFDVGVPSATSFKSTMPPNYLTEQSLQQLFQKSAASKALKVPNDYKKVFAILVLCGRGNYLSSIVDDEVRHLKQVFEKEFGFTVTVTPGKPSYLCLLGISMREFDLLQSMLQSRTVLRLTLVYFAGHGLSDGYQSTSRRRCSRHDRVLHGRISKRHGLDQPHTRLRTPRGGDRGSLELFVLLCTSKQDGEKDAAATGCC